MEIPCKECISFAICNSRFRQFKIGNIFYVARELINKCSIIRNHLKEFHQIRSSTIHNQYNKYGLSLYSNHDKLIIVNAKPFISSFVNASKLSHLSNDLFNIEIYYDELMS